MITQMHNELQELRTELGIDKLLVEHENKLALMSAMGTDTGSGPVTNKIATALDKALEALVYAKYVGGNVGGLGDTIVSTISLIKSLFGHKKPVVSIVDTNVKPVA